MNPVQQRGLNQATEIRPVAQVENEVSQLEKIAEILNGKIEAISGRLLVICRSNNHPPEAPPSPEPTLVPLAEQIRSLRQRIARSVSVLEDLHDSIEL